MPDSHRLLCALVIGHKHQSPGAVNEDSGTTEFEFNDALGRDIEARQDTVRIQRVYRRTYRQLPDDINELAPDFVVSLHCNAYNKRTAGSEVLYYHRSERGRQIAEILSVRLAESLRNRNRGIRPRSAEERGGFLLRYTDAPCVIAEPFFIDNDDEYANARSRRRYLVKAYLEAIEEIATILRPTVTMAPQLRAAALAPVRAMLETGSGTGSTRAAPIDTAVSAGDVATSGAWNSSIAHQVSIDYWARAYPESYVDVLANPQVRDMSFFNAEVTPEVRRNEMRIVAGGFLAFHAALGNISQPGGISDDEAFNLLVIQFTEGECRLSLSGDVTDACYLFAGEAETG